MVSLLYIYAMSQGQCQLLWKIHTAFAMQRCSHWGWGLEPPVTSPVLLELPNEMTLCTRGYEKLPFWVLVTPLATPHLKKKKTGYAPQITHNSRNLQLFLIAITRNGHQNLNLVWIDLNQVHLIGPVERNILVFKSSKSDVPLQIYGF